MRWKLLRRRLSISAPRMIVRSHLPWPLRWAVVALALGFSAAIGAVGLRVRQGHRRPGPRREGRTGAAARRGRAAARRARAGAVDRQHGRQPAEGRTAAQERLAQQLRQIEAENLALQGRPGLLRAPAAAAAGEGLTMRGLQAELQAPGQLRYQLLVMQSGKAAPEFNGRYEIELLGHARRQALDAARSPGGPQAAAAAPVRAGGRHGRPPPAGRGKNGSGPGDRSARVGGARHPDRARAEASQRASIGKETSHVVRKKRQPPIRSLIGDGTVVHGELRFADGLRIDGEVHGDVLAVAERSQHAGDQRESPRPWQGQGRACDHQRRGSWARSIATNCWSCSPRRASSAMCATRRLKCTRAPSSMASCGPLKSADKPTLTLAASNDL